MNFDFIGDMSSGKALSSSSIKFNKIKKVLYSIYLYLTIYNKLFIMGKFTTEKKINKN